ncbi:hypothetical protein TrST_g7028 [Triparma strigata]|uniref:CCHC-type domain-containing protein n=1 Tax=Triparma strigata TaxID=1606541 RepID=A0A9W7E9E7_9STRA|nr:hypothetical protein TrST_g7028 [Triparma strigata]
MFPSRNPEFDGPTVVEIETKSSRAGEESTPNSPKITKNLKNMGLENRSHRVTDEEAVQEDGKQTKLEEVMVEGVGAAGHQHKSIRPNLPSPTERINYLQEAQMHLKALESDRQSKRRKRSVVNLGDSYKIGPAKASKNSGRTCTNCGKTGHDRRNCNKPRLNSSGEVIVSQRKCTRCGSLKHDRRTCLVTAKQLDAQEVRTEMMNMHSAPSAGIIAPHSYPNPAQVQAQASGPNSSFPLHRNPFVVPPSMGGGMNSYTYALPPGYPMPPYHPGLPSGLPYGHPSLPYGYMPAAFSVRPPPPGVGGSLPPSYPPFPSGTTLPVTNAKAEIDNGSDKPHLNGVDNTTADKNTSEDDTQALASKGHDAAHLLLLFGKKS